MSADNPPDQTPAEADQARAQKAFNETNLMLRERLGPHIGEHFDCWLLLGYIPTDNGPQRMVVYNDQNNAMFKDALRPALVGAIRWAHGGVDV